MDADEKQFAASVMSFATAWHTTPLLLIAIPMVAMFVPVKAVLLVMRGKPLTPENIFDHSAKSGKFSSLVSSAMFKARPLIAVWLCAWALPALLVLAILGAVRTAPAILQRSIEAVLSRAVHQ